MLRSAFLRASSKDERSAGGHASRCGQAPAPQDEARTSREPGIQRSVAHLEIPVYVLRTQPGTTNSFSSFGRNLVERHILVHADVAGQPKHAFGDDVAQDFVSAAG